MRPEPLPAPPIPSAALLVIQASIGSHLPAGISAAIRIRAELALPLFASGLGALGLLDWRRKRKATPPIRPTVKDNLA